MKQTILVSILLLVVVTFLVAQEKTLEIKKPLGEEEPVLAERSLDRDAMLKTMIEKANTGDAYSQFKLGEEYYYGITFPQDYDSAVKYFKSAAEQDLPEAISALGLCYKHGHGVEQDMKMAYSQFAKAAEMKNPDAQFNLGVMYYNGEGVQANNKEAAKWFKLAADQGHCSAQSNLGICYYEGTGVAMDNIESYFWLSLAANLCPPQYVDEYNKTRDKVKAELKDAEIEKVDVRVKEWMYKNKQ